LPFTNEKQVLLFKHNDKN
jgi:hypothetical protein